MAVLDTIVAHTQAQTARLKRRLPAAELLDLAATAAPPVRSFRAAVTPPPASAATGADNTPQLSHARIIAEVKRASPSRGVLRPGDGTDEWDPEGLAQSYERGGAAALSVLTNGPFFWGSADTLEACRDATGLPVLRKDFILEPYQVVYSRWIGADAVLLIARLLDAAALQDCAQQAAELGMDVLLEVHDADELGKALAIPNAIIGVNHRDLDTLQIDPNRATDLKAQLPAADNRLLVAESGLRGPADLQRLQQAGIHTFLIGERLAQHPNPQAMLRHFLGGPKPTL